MKTPWSGAEWRKVLVYGLGLSGLAAARLLRARGVGVVAVDRRPAAQLDLGELASDPGLELRSEAELTALPAGLDGVVLSPGVPPDRPLLAAARRAALPVIAEVELAFPFLEGPVVGITGSNGKSTTTALAGAMLRRAGLAVEVCGNIGEPLSARVAGPPGRVFVVELSSFQLEALATFRARAAALLNLAPDHLDRYPSMAEYAAAKAHLFDRQREEDVAVIHGDDPALAELARGLARRRLFSRRRVVADGCYQEEDRVLEAIPGAPPAELFHLDDLPLAGVHNLENAMAAALLARAFGAAPEPLAAALRDFRGLPHRLQRVGEWNGVTFYDDSKGTNVAATARSLEGFPEGSVHLILGGLHKGDDPAALVEPARRKARRLYFIGAAAGLFEETLGRIVPGERCETLERAVAAAVAAARPGEVVLLSPACASYDQFASYAERGERFQQLVRAAMGTAGSGAGAATREARGGGDGQEAGL